METERRRLLGHTHARVRPVRPARRLAWLGLGVFCVAFAAFEVAKHGGRPLALALVFAIAPDLAMLIGASRKLAPGQLAPKAVPFYNAVHRVGGPVALLVACTFFVSGAALFTGGLAWLAHVAIDRAAGFGLRTPEGFQRG
jgi:type IV secretory pathway VirB2 component (pilin)